MRIVFNLVNVDFDTVVGSKDFQGFILFGQLGLMLPRLV